jgi:exonuclease SbcD
MKILHFADAHIDMANYGRHDPETGLPLRVLDFLKSLDAIIAAAISEKVDHDLSPAIGRANAIQEFETLDIPHVTVLAKPQFLSAEELGLPVQVIALPWIARSGLIAATDTSPGDTSVVFENIETRLTELVNGWLENADPSLPVILTAHASVQGATFGSERTVMLGADLVLPGSLVRDPRLDYVALGHIHKPQDLNKNAHPPVIYPGSIERVDFGEADDDKFFIIAEIEKGKTNVDWRKLKHIRPFIDRQCILQSPEGVTEAIIAALPAEKKMAGAILRLIVEYPREWDTLIDEPALRTHTAGTFEFHLVKRPQVEARIRLPAGQTVSSLSPLELLEQYENLQKMAQEIIAEE